MTLFRPGLVSFSFVVTQNSLYLIHVKQAWLNMYIDHMYCMLHISYWRPDFLIQLGLPAQCIQHLLFSLSFSFLSLFSLFVLFSDLSTLSIFTHGIPICALYFSFFSFTLAISPSSILTRPYHRSNFSFCPFTFPPLSLFPLLLLSPLSSQYVLISFCSFLGLLYVIFFFSVYICI